MANEIKEKVFQRCRCFSVAFTYSYSYKSCRSLYFSDFGPNAIWRSTLITTEAYLARTPLDQQSPCFKIRGHRKELAYWDWLHVCPLGILRDHTGTHIWIWLQEHLVEHAILDIGLALRALWGRLKAFCKQRGISTPPGSFTYASLGSPTGTVYPELGSSFKAAAIKTITTFVADVSYHVERSDLLGKARCTNTWAIAELQFVLDQAGVRLTKVELKRALYAATSFLFTLQFLCNSAISDGKALFKLRPKHHYFCHILMRLQLDMQNPCKQLQCAGEETFMGVIKRIGSQTHGGTAYVRTFQRYLIYLAVRWEQRRRTGRWFLNK